jgi:hypothetical protein
LAGTLKWDKKEKKKIGYCNGTEKKKLAIEMERARCYKKKIIIIWLELVSSRDEFH